jgi:predicted transcriptional regulator
MGAKSITLPEDLLAAVSETAEMEGKTPEQVGEAAIRRYLAKARLERFAQRNEERAHELGIKETDVPRIVKEWRREQHGH